MLIPFAPILTLCVLLRSLLLQSLDYQVASDAFHLGGYFLLDVRYIEPPATPYPNSPLLLTFSVPHPMLISSRVWADATPTPASSRTIQASSATLPNAADVSPLPFRHLPPPKFKPSQAFDETTPPVTEPPSPIYELLPDDTLTNVTPSNETQTVASEDPTSSPRPFLSLRSIIVQVLDSQRAELIVLAISAFFGLLILGICLHIIRRPLAAQPRSDSVEHTRCGHEEMIRDVRWLLAHFGADKDISLAEFCRSLQVVDMMPSSNGLSQPVSPNFGMSSSYTTLAQSPLTHKSVVRKRMPLFNALPTPDPSGTGQQNAQSRSGPHIMSTADSELSDLFAFDPPAASSPVRTISQTASKVSAALSLERWTSWSSFRLPRSTAPDVIDRMNENRSLFFDNLFKRLDRLGGDSPAQSIRSSEGHHQQALLSRTRLNQAADIELRCPTLDVGVLIGVIGAKPLEGMKMRGDISPMQFASSQAKPASDKRSITPQATHVRHAPTTEDYFKPLQHKPFMARFTSELQR
ncbi:hypothetical protein BDV93DRAFT_506718 [Ceratobasidium sp. AG-I]|nr:hypothetical protein BDV93DRAFT_506718 [Ceratobasidium sp. AG-I]